MIGVAGAWHRFISLNIQPRLLSLLVPPLRWAAAASFRPWFGFGGLIELDPPHESRPGSTPHNKLK